MMPALAVAQAPDEGPFMSDLDDDGGDFADLVPPDPIPAVAVVPVDVRVDAGDLRESRSVDFTLLANFALVVASTRLHMTFWSALE